MSPVTSPVPHPFDPLSLAEIETAITTVKKAHGDVFFNVVSLHEPRKAEMTTWLASPDTAPRPARIADVVVIAPGGKVYDGLVELADPKITKWELMEGVQPIVSASSLVMAKRNSQGMPAANAEDATRSQWKNSR
jgi:primary-amine oxidase